MLPKSSLIPLWHPFLDDKYVALSLLKKSSETTTYVASEKATGNKVIIKEQIVDSQNPQIRLTLQAQIENLKNLSHLRGIAPILDFAILGDRCYIVSRFFNGSPLDKIFQHRQLSVEEILSMGISLSRTLSNLHQQGALHGNLRPSNVLLQDDHFILLDLGSAPRGMGSILFEASHPVSYLSPENAGLARLGVDQRSDLYSLGALLYEAIAGKPPFIGKDLDESFRKQIAEPPEDLHALGLPLPKMLSEIVFKLIRKDPDERYQSADALLFDLNEVRRLSLRGEKDGFFILGKFDTRSNLTEPSFIGRTSEMHQLEGALQKAQGGQAQLCIVQAESGLGKTRLLDEFSKKALQKGITVFSGEGLSLSAKTPYQLFQNMVTQLLEKCAADLVFQHVLKTKLANYAGPLSAAFPQFKALFGKEDLNIHLPEATGEMAIQQSLITLINSIGTHKEPALFILDDCQWGDDASLKLIDLWNASTKVNQHQSQTMIVLSARTEELPANHLLSQLEPDVRVSLGALTRNEVIDLINSMTGNTPIEVFETINRLSLGNPFMTIAVLRGLVEIDALVPSSKGWIVQPSMLSQIRSSEKAASFLTRRLNFLSEDTLKLLARAALLGKAFDLEILSLVEKKPLDQILADLMEARLRHFVWIDEAKQLGVFVHDRIREALLNTLSKSARQSYHSAIAECMKSKYPDRVFDIAFHFDAASEVRKALPFALKAAQLAKAQFTPQLAEQHYRIAQRGLLSSERDLRLEVALGLGKLLVSRSDFEGASKELDEARFLARTPLEKAQAIMLWGDNQFRTGRVTEARADLHRALRILGCYVPHWSLTCLVFVAFQAMIQKLHALFPWYFLERMKTPLSERDSLIVAIIEKLGYVNWFGGSLFQAGYFHYYALNKLERHKKGSQLAQAYALHTHALFMFSKNLTSAIDYAQRSFEIRDQLDDEWGRAESLYFKAQSYFVNSLYNKAIETSEEALKITRRLGDRWQANGTLWMIAYSYYRLGDLGRATKMGQMMLKIGREMNDPHTLSNGLNILAKATGGKVERRLIAEELKISSGDSPRQIILHQADGICLLRESEYEKALETLERALKIRPFWEQEFTVPLYCWLSTAYRSYIRSLQGFDSEEGRRALRRGFYFAKKSVRKAKIFRNNLPHALREYGYFLALRGRLKKAEQAFKSSIEIASSQKAQYEYALSLTALGELKRSQGLPEGESLVFEGQKLALQIERQIPEEKPAKATGLVLAARFDNLIDWGRKIASQLNVDEIQTSAVNASQKILFGETAVFLKVKIDHDEKRLLIPVAGYSRTFDEALALRALDEEKVAVYEEDDESVRPQTFRSAICSPVMVAGKPYGCLYVTHKELGKFFGDEEKRLIEFISTITGASIEGAKSFSKLKETADQLIRTNKELEQFAYVASHDLKEPLRMVASYTQLLERKYVGELDEIGRGYVAFAVEGVTRMRGMIDDLLTYSKSTSRMTSKPVNLNAAVQKAIKLLEFVVKEENAEIQIDRLPMVRGEENQIVHLFQNLIGNALKFKREAPRIHISSQRKGSHWQITVKDNGLGIESKYFDQIFVIFKRLQDRRSYAGTGIGLAICKKIVESNGGKIWIESEPGVGSKFHFTLPISAAK